MSAKLIFDHAPIGAIIAYSDGTPRPPERHRKKLADWKNRNGAGRLICKQAAIERGAHTIPASFTLHGYPEAELQEFTVPAPDTGRAA